MQKSTINIRNLFLVILTYILIIMHGAVIWSAIIGDSYASILIVAAFVMFTIAISHLPFRKSFLLLGNVGCIFSFSKEMGGVPVL